MKFIKKFLIIFICTFISFVLQINYARCSDNGPVVQQPAQTHQQSQGMDVQQQQAVPQPPSISEPGTSNIESGGAVKTNHGFIPMFLKMIKTLFGVVLLIIVIAGVIIFNRRIKSKRPSKLRIKKQKQQEVEKREPANVSEAVASFVRHKIKRTS